MIDDPPPPATVRAARRPRPFVGALVLVLAVALAGCGPAIRSGDEAEEGGAAGARSVLQPPSGDNPAGEITIWSRSGDLFTVFEAAIDDFNRKYPGITVHHEAVDIDAKLQNTLITGSDVPDGVFLDDAKVAGFAEHLWDLSAVMAPYRADVAQQKLDVNSLGGSIYGVPFDSNPGLLYYNDTALRAAGVDPTAIRTYDDLLAAARQYKSVRPDAGPIHLEQDAFLGQLQLEMYASQLGTSLADEKGALRLDSPEYEQILTWLDTVRREGLGTRAEYLSPSDVGALESGSQVFYPWAMWFNFAPQQMLTETTGDWRAMLLPAWQDGGARSGAMGGSSFVLPKEGKNSALAWLFYEFLVFDQAGYSAVYGPSETYPEGLSTSIPSYRPAADPVRPLFKPLPALGGQDLWPVAVEAADQIPGGTPTPAWWTGAVEYLGNDVQRMLDGDLTPRGVIEQAGGAIQTNLVDR